MTVKTIKKLLLTIVLSFGLIGVIVEVCANAGIWLKNAFIHVRKPEFYTFEPYDKLLNAFVADKLVDYAAMKKSPLLAQAVNELETVSPENFSTDDAKMCFWINAYNLLVLKMVCDHYPVKSILRLGNAPSFIKYTVGGTSYSLTDILAGKLVPYINKDPLSCFLICGGAQGDPFLLNHAIQPNKVKFDEKMNVARFVNDSRNTLYDDVANKFYIAPYFQRYAEPISLIYKSPHDMVCFYLKDNKVDIGSITLLRVYFPKFNWALNDKAIGIYEPPNRP